MPESIEDIERQMELMKQKLAELEKKKEEMSKPVTAAVENVLMTGIGGIFEVKFSRFDQKCIDRIRSITSRRYINSREVNQFGLDDYDRVVYELNEVGIKLEISEELLAKVNEWKNTPDFSLSFDERKKQIRIDRTIRQKSLPYMYDMETWTYHHTMNYYTFSQTELIEWMKLQAGFQKNGVTFEVSDDVLKIYNEQIEREKLLDQFADMKDAVDFDYTFSQINPKTNEPYKLNEDQRVACKFDSVFGNRSLISFDMGKGKTAIAIAQAERYNERVLFICKADLKTNIKREIKKFTGKDAVVFSGIEPDGLAIDLMVVRKNQYNILNYDVIGRSIEDKEKGISIMKWVEVINLAGFDRIVYDEAHYMANIETQRSKGGRAIKAPKVMLLTGTPIVNRPGEIFPALNIIDSTTFYDPAIFLRQFTTDGFHPKNLDKLHKLLKKYMIRRLKDTSLDPNRMEQYHTLSQQARINYSKVFEGIYIALRNPDYTKDVNNILVELMRCKQICADDKVDFTVDLAETALDETSEMPWNKVLIYSQFKATQYEIAKRLGNKARIINGEVTDKRRYEIVDEFQDPSSPLKVIVTNITEGLTLTNAFTTITNDLAWNWKAHSQFEGRAFGRTNDPHGGNSYYILAEDTIDDMIWTLIAKKMEMSKQIVDDVYTHQDYDEGMFSELMKMIKGGK